MPGDAVKRLLDVTVAVLGLLVVSPVVLVVAALVRLDSPGPMFHRAVRIGKDGRPFRLYKFRSMIKDAHRNGPVITPAGDSRITRVGQFLRRTKLDELPQLFNVLKGDMSLVGPRPEDPRYVALYTGAQRAVLRVRPGVTSPASLAYRHESLLLSGPDWEQQYVNEILPEKLAIELDYLAHRNVLSDVRLLFRTLGALSRRDAPQEAVGEPDTVQDESSTTERRL